MTKILCVFFSAQAGEISVTEYYRSVLSENTYAYVHIFYYFYGTTYSYLNIIACSLGQTTEFRYVIKVAEGVNNGFYGLQGYYDPVI